MLDPLPPLRTVWDRARDFAGVVWRSPWLTIALLALFAVQTVRVDGLQVRLPLIGTIGPQGWKPRALEAEAVIERVREAQAEAERLARDAKKSEEAALVALAERTDENVEKKLDSELDRARDFIARNRVRTEGNRGAACPASAPTRDQGTGNDAETGGAPVMDDADKPDRVDDDTGLVSVPARDVMICTRNTVLAEQWRDWGLALEARGRE